MMAALIDFFFLCTKMLCNARQAGSLLISWMVRSYVIGLHETIASCYN